MENKDKLNGIEETLIKLREVKRRVDTDGMEFTFMKLSKFEDIEDMEFHKLRRYLITHIELMDHYLKIKVNELEEKYEKISKKSS